MTYNNFREVCKQIINDNLRTDEFLRIDDFKEFFEKLCEQKDLHFYKFLSPTPMAFDNFERDYLSFCNPRYFNDIYEGMIRQKGSPKAKMEPKRLETIIQKACDSVAITCLTETWNNMLMYSHYADSFKGFCLEYSMQKMIEHLPESMYFFPVIYQNRPSSLAEMEKMENILSEMEKKIKSTSTINLSSISEADDLVSYFIHKNGNWKYEREWRFIIPKSKFGEFFPSQRIGKKYHQLVNFDCISAVYLGARASEETKNELIAIVEEKNKKRGNSDQIKVYETHISFGSYKMKKKQI